MKLQFNVVVGTDAMKADLMLSSDEDKGQQLYQMHEITVPGLAFERDGKVLEDRWQALDKGKYQRFIAYHHDGKQVVSMFSGIRYPDGNIRIFNTATREEYRGQGLFEKTVCEFICQQEVGIKLMGSLNTGIRNDAFLDPALAAKKEQLQGDFVKAHFGRELPRGLTELLRDQEGSQQYGGKENFQMVASLISRLSHDDVTFDLSRGGSTVNLVATIPVTEQLKEKAAGRIEEINVHKGQDKLERV